MLYALLQRRKINFHYQVRYIYKYGIEQNHEAIVTRRKFHLEMD